MTRETAWTAGWFGTDRLQCRATRQALTLRNPTAAHALTLRHHEGAMQARSLLAGKGIERPGR